ncbi:MAG: hypothetical protein WB439_18040 [Acidobacteriaceae bacterium]
MSHTTHSPLNPHSSSAARHAGRCFYTSAAVEDQIHASLDLSYQATLPISHIDRHIIDQMRDNHPCSLCY